MKKKIYLGILILEAIVCVIFCVLGTISGENVADMMAFPFAPIGKGLRALSLSGSVGNIVAILLYGGISLLPLGLVLFHAKKKILHAEDALLVGYLVFRVLRLFFSAEKEKLQSYVSLMLGLLNMILVYMIFGVCLQKFLQTLENTKAANQGTEDGLTFTYVFIFLQLLADALPYVLDMVIVFACQHMIVELQKDAYSEETMEAAGKLTRVCGQSLKVTILSIVAFNLLQLLCAKNLRVLNGFVNIPILSIILVLTALLVAKLVAEGKQLKDDNDMFI